MKKIISIVTLAGVLMFGVGCTKTSEAPMPASTPAPHGGGGGEVMPQPTFVANADANWKAAKVMVVAKDGSEEKEVELEFAAPDGTKVTVAGVTVTLKAVQMVPDFVMSGSNVGSRSTELNNPAVQLIITEEGKEPLKQWLFEKMPSVHAFEHETITVSTTGFVEKGAGGGHGPGDGHGH